ncbi:MAG: hypothetical protein Q7I89_09310 [Syntrophales bacterium]|nr:hypothetical protein [Syntrophales bacterium]
MKDRSFTSPVEWTASAMTANRALAPDSKRGVEEWVREDVALGNPESMELQHLYRAMDVLLEYREIIHKEASQPTGFAKHCLAREEPAFLQRIGL